MKRACNTENMQKWIDALRSGKYTQGTSRLKRRRTSKEIVHCCLGVACEVMGLSSELVAPDIWAFTHDPDTWGNTQESVGLPMVGYNWLGIARDGLRFDHGETESIQVEILNDVYHWTFEMIADALEERYIPSV